MMFFPYFSKDIKDIFCILTDIVLDKENAIKNCNYSYFFVQLFILIKMYFFEQRRSGIFSMPLLYLLVWCSLNKPLVRFT